MDICHPERAYFANEGPMHLVSVPNTWVLRSQKPLSQDDKAYSWSLRKRSEFVMTDTELKLIAAAARIGLSSNPKKG
jgi:hypothetical protein